MRTNSREGRITIAVVIAAAVLAGALAAFICSAAAQDEPQLSQLLEKSGLKYHKLDDQSWIVPFDGKDGKTMDVYVTYNNDKKKFAMIFTTVINKDDNFDYSKQPKLLVECMKLNNDYPACKFCLDADNGDIDCQSEVYMDTVTPESLKMHIELVAALADSKGADLNALLQ